MRMRGHARRWVSGLAVGFSVFAAVFAQAPAAVRSTIIDAPALLADLKALSSDDTEGHRIGKPGGARARALVEARFTAAGLVPFGTTYLQPFTSSPRRGGVPGLTGVNVVGRLDGRATAGRYIVVSAHYDHVGIRNGQVYNGADDNASGTAAVLQMAAHFKARPPRHTMLFVFFDAEELGLVGARGDHLIEKLYRDVKAMDIVEGTGQIQRMIIARHLLGLPRDQASE